MSRSTVPSRPSRARRVLRWAGRVTAGVVALLCVAGAAVYGLSERRMRAHFDVAEHPLAITSDSATLARGRHLAAIHGCTECHGPALGGRVLLENAAIGRIAAPNVSVGGRGAALTPADWERAVRHGLRRDGSPLLFMPAHEFAGAADDEVAAIVAFALSLPAQHTTVPPMAPGPLARALFLTGQIALVPAERIDQAAPHAAHVVVAPDSAYGAHLAAGCIGCHGPTYAGGKIPGTPPDWPPAPNLTPTGIGRWTLDDFERALREGRRPDRSPIRPPMPLGATRQMTDVELEALWAYLRTLPPRPTGTR